MKKNRGESIIKFHKGIEMMFELAEVCEACGLEDDCEVLSKACESAISTFYFLDDIGIAMPKYMASYFNRIYKIVRDRVSKAIVAP